MQKRVLITLTVTFLLFLLIFSYARAQGEVRANSCDADTNCEISSRATIRGDAPVVSFSETDRNNKLWHSGVYNSGFVISESGVADRVYISAGGNVGIGTTNPQNKLDIIGNVGIAGDVCLVSGQCLSQVGRGGNSNSTNPWIVRGNNIYAINTGNVGIGTDNPQYKLAVAGNIQASGDVCTSLNGGVCLSTAQRGGGNSNNSGNQGDNIWGIGGNPPYYIYSSRGEQLFLRDLNSANSPSSNARIEIQNSRDEMLRLLKTGASRWNYISWFNNGERRFWTGLNEYGSFQISPGDRSGGIVVDPTGYINVLQGMYVHGNLIIPAGAGRGKVLASNYAGQASWTNINELINPRQGDSFWAANGNSIYNTNGDGIGWVGIGTTNPQAPLEVRATQTPDYQATLRLTKSGSQANYIEFYEDEGGGEGEGRSAWIGINQNGNLEISQKHTGQGIVDSIILGGNLKLNNRITVGRAEADRRICHELMRGTIQFITVTGDDGSQEDKIRLCIKPNVNSQTRWYYLQLD